ncbi:MAG TPA: hypothetical protein VFN21_01485 [Acidimicrobiales bacterium]|nr:hypothetical protein [Acidimicrobiales bacterium]
MSDANGHRPATTDRGLRWLYRGVIAATITPIVISAIRNGLADWEPTWDAATAAVRIRDVFSAHPPLIGLAASTSLKADQHYSFLGAFEWYLLATPVHFLGTTWGILLGIAVVNSIACATAIWLIRRRVGERGAIVASIALASVLWTIGSQAMVDPSQHHVGVLVVFCFFVAAWSVADRDTPALVVLVISGTYLMQGTMKYSLVVPVIGAWALAVWFVRLRRVHTAETTTDETPRPVAKRWLAAAILLAVVLWIPPAIDQVAGTGNMGKLVHAFVNGEANDGAVNGGRTSLTGSAGVVAAVTATPPWWLPPTYAHLPFSSSGGGAPLAWRVLWALTLLGLAGLSVSLAIRRRDWCIVTGISFGMVAWLTFFVTALLDPSPIGFAPVYFRGLWPFAALLWFIILWGLVRAMPRVRRPLLERDRFVLGGATALVVVVVALAVPFKDVDTFAETIGPARDIRSAVATGFAGSDGPVVVDAKILLERYQPSVVLGLQDAGVGARFPGSYEIQQFGTSRAVRGDEVAKVSLRQSPGVPEGGRLVGRIRIPTAMSQEEFAAVNAKMKNWAASLSSLKVGDRAATTAAGRRQLDTAAAAIFRDPKSRSGALVNDPRFVQVLATWPARWTWPIFDIPGVSAAQGERWGLEKSRRVDPYLYVISSPLED